mmetsp:Transcript_29829/g.85371  ORF Transcript_29829/g.85371 Transcript_29829/m.85371 type:complete len:241 (+) Transcript_29829:763-1485(+)
MRPRMSTRSKGRFKGKCTASNNMNSIPALLFSVRCLACSSALMLMSPPMYVTFSMPGIRCCQLASRQGTSNIEVMPSSRRVCPRHSRKDTVLSGVFSKPLLRAESSNAVLRSIKFAIRCLDLSSRMRRARSCCSRCANLARSRSASFSSRRRFTWRCSSAEPLSTWSRRPTATQAPAAIATTSRTGKRANTEGAGAATWEAPAPLASVREEPMTCAPPEAELRDVAPAASLGCPSSSQSE